MDLNVLLPLLKAAASIWLLFHVVNQVRKPTRITGRLFTWIMNRSHSSLTDWALTHVHVANHFTILDVGCGGGLTIQKLAAKATNGVVHGIDYAVGSVAASRALNQQLINAGRVKIEKASVSQLPFPENTFDLVTAVETQYYWPNPVKDMREIARVLRPGGVLAIIVESYNSRGNRELGQALKKRLKYLYLTPDEQRQLFVDAGFTSIEIFEESAKGWLCAVGKKAS